jgi:hypothetical protein
MVSSAGTALARPSRLTLRAFAGSSKPLEPRVPPSAVVRRPPPHRRGSHAAPPMRPSPLGPAGWRGLGSMNRMAWQCMPRRRSAATGGGGRRLQLWTERHAVVVAAAKDKDEWADVRHRRALKSPLHRAVAVLLQTAWCVLRGAVLRAAARCGVPHAACGGVAAC